MRLFGTSRDLMEPRESMFFIEEMLPEAMSRPYVYGLLFIDSEFFDLMWGKNVVFGPIDGVMRPPE